MIRIRQMMKTRLIQLDPAMDIYEAMAVFTKQKISGAPVINESGKLVGILSEKDCMKVMVQAAFDRLPSGEVQDFMSTEVKAIAPDATLMTAVDIFLSHPFRRLPVMDDGKLVGQISRREVLSAILALQNGEDLGMRFRSEKDDATESGSLNSIGASAVPLVGPLTNQRFG
jgi:CBS domain-containing protein